MPPRVLSDDLSPAARRAVLRRGVARAEALALFDSLPAVRVAEMIGIWRGEEVPTGHPLDGLLAPLGWIGKQFTGPDEVQPLVFEGPKGAPIYLSPGLLPMQTLVRHAPLLRRWGAARLFPLVRGLLRTTDPQARLRDVDYRGVVSAAMVYDRQPIIDPFRRLDSETLLGLMDLRDCPEPYVYMLRRPDCGGTS